MAAPAGGPRLSGEDPGYLGRPADGEPDRRRADRRQIRHLRRGLRHHAGRGPGPLVRGVRTALRLSHHPAGAADPSLPAAAVLRRVHRGAGVLYVHGGHDAVGGAGLRHAGLRAAGAAGAPRQRSADQPGHGAAGDPAGQPLRRRVHQSAAELCRHLRHRRAVRPAVSPVFRLVSGEGQAHPADAGLRLRQSGGVPQRHDLHGAVGGLLLQHAVAGVAAGQSAGGAFGGVQLHVGLYHHAGGLRVASGGAGAGMDCLRPDPYGAVAGLCADPVAVPCGVFRQSLPAAVAGGDVSGLRPVRRGEEMAEAEVLVRRGGHPSGAGAGHLVQHPDLPHRQHERDGAGRGPG